MSGLEGKYYRTVPTKMLTDSNTNTAPKADKWLFERLPAYAGFLRDNFLIPYVQEQLRISREVELPMLKYLAGISDDDLFNMSVISTREFLTAVEKNEIQDHVERSLMRWLADDFGIIKQDEISAEDILLAGYLRKKTMTKFLSSYTADVSTAIEIIKEIDDYTKESDLAFSNVYIKIGRAHV